MATKLSPVLHQGWPSCCSAAGGCAFAMSLKKDLGKLRRHHQFTPNPPLNCISTELCYETIHKKLVRMFMDLLGHSLEYWLCFPGYAHYMSLYILVLGLHEHRVSRHYRNSCRNSQEYTPEFPLHM